MKSSALRGRISGLADQGVSSMSNLIVSVSLAHVSSRGEFGAFGVAFAVYLAAITIGRGAVGQIATLKLSGLGNDEAIRETRAATAASAILGTAVGAPILVVGLLLHGIAGAMLATVGGFLPILLLQDSLRYAGFALHRPNVALVNDLCWLVLQLATLPVFLVVGWSGPPEIFASWAFASSAGVVAGSVLLHTLPAWSEGLIWFRKYGSLLRSLLTEQAFISGVAQGVPLLVGAVSGMTAVGSLKAAQTAFGPLTAFNTGLSMAVVPSAARDWSRGDRHFFVPLQRNGAVVAALAIAWAMVLWVMPASWGEVALSGNWNAVRELCIPTGIWLACGFASAPAISALRIVGRQWWSAKARMALTPVMLLGALSGAWVAGANGATIGLASATSLSAVALWCLFSRAAKTLSAPESPIVRLTSVNDLTGTITGTVKGDL